MIAEGIVRCDGRGDQVGALRFDSRVDVLAVIAVRKAIERSLFHCGHVVRYKVVTEIVPDGPAAKAGLQKDDVIVGMNGKEVDGRSLRNAVGSMAPGTSINLKVLRSGAERALTVTLDRMQEETRRASR